MSENKSPKELARVVMSTSLERGLQLYIKSNQDFSFLGAKDKQTFNLGGVKCFVPKDGDGSQLAGVQGRFRTNKDTFNDEGLPNLSLLMACDLKEGVTFNFGIFPITKERVDEFIENLKIQMKLIFLTYCKPYTVSVVWNCETIESETHD